MRRYKEIENPEILTFTCWQCCNTFLSDEMYSSLQDHNYLCCKECRKIEEDEIAESYGEVKLNELISKHGTKMDWQYYEDIPSNILKANDFEFDELDNYLDNYDDEIL
jgi:hypothetical protein